MRSLAPSRVAVKIAPPRDLLTSELTTVRIGSTPLGLPWVLTVDRQRQLADLEWALCSAYGVRTKDQLPPRARRHLEADLRSDLIGVHDGGSLGGAARLFVSRSPLKRLLGSTLLARLIRTRSETVIIGSATPRAATNAVAAQAAGPSHPLPIEDIESAIIEQSTARHLGIDCDSGAPAAVTVKRTDLALRTPSAPIRPLLLETALAFAGARARVSVGPSHRDVPLAEFDLDKELADTAFDGDSTWIQYLVPRAAIVAAIVSTARKLGAHDRSGVIHGDLSPGNVLMAADGPVLIDDDRLPIGQIGRSVTFTWASPEQILARPLDARSNVFTLAKMVCTIIGGVPFGEETRQIVPIGGRNFERVELLKCEGVFVDILDTGYSRAWQKAWCELLSSAMHFDPARRPCDILSFADRLAAVAEEHPVVGSEIIETPSGEIVRAELDGEIRHVCRIFDDPSWTTQSGRYRLEQTRIIPEGSAPAFGYSD